MHMKPKKILILIIAFILLFFLLIILVYRRTGAGIIQEQTPPSPFEEGFVQESTEEQNNFVIKSFLWKKIEGGLPENISFLSSSKRSPLGNMTGVIANGQLNIDRDFTRLQKIEDSANISAVIIVFFNVQNIIIK